MKPLIAATIFICATITSAAAESEHSNRPRSMELPLPQFGPDHLSRGIGIVWGGSENAPIISVFYITEHRKLPEAALFRYVYLTDREYEELLRFTRSTPCSREHISSRPPYPGSIHVQEFSKHEVRELCVFPKEGGCEYLFGIAALPGIDWSRKDTYPLYQFEAELGCKKPWTQSHDADGRPN